MLTTLASWTPPDPSLWSAMLSGIRLDKGLRKKSALLFSLKDHASQHFDIIAFNRYYAWYSDSGHTEVIKEKLYNDLANWRRARGQS